MCDELDNDRIAAVERVQKVETALGVTTDAMQSYFKPLATNLSNHKES